MEQKGVKGRVYICGAGPGDTGLMTLRAMELVKTCDVILYDRLVGQGIVDQFPVGAEKVYVGRAVGDPTTHQKRTNEMMVRYARMGKSVLRLKGGDPFIFGRGAEEAEYLLKKGIEFEIIPGITSAIASPAYAGIPLTHRQHSSSVAIVTGHEGEDNKGSSPVDWKKLPGAVDTIVDECGIRREGARNVRIDPVVLGRLHGADRGLHVEMILTVTNQGEEVIVEVTAGRADADGRNIEAALDEIVA